MQVTKHAQTWRVPLSMNYIYKELTLKSQHTSLYLEKTVVC